MYKLRALKRVARATSSIAPLYSGWFLLSDKGEGGVIGPEPLEISSNLT